MLSASHTRQSAYKLLEEGDSDQKELKIEGAISTKKIDCNIRLRYMDNIPVPDCKGTVSHTRNTCCTVSFEMFDLQSVFHLSYRCAPALHFGTFMSGCPFAQWDIGITLTVICCQ